MALLDEVIQKRFTDLVSGDHDVSVFFDCITQQVKDNLATVAASLQKGRRADAHLGLVEFCPWNLFAKSFPAYSASSMSANSSLTTSRSNSAIPLALSSCSILFGPYPRRLSPGARPVARKRLIVNIIQRTEFLHRRR